MKNLLPWAVLALGFAALFLEHRLTAALCIIGWMLLLPGGPVRRT